MIEYLGKDFLEYYKANKTALDNSAAQALLSANIAALKATESEASAVAANESEINSKESEEISNQAMTDLLKMMGSDIATLLGGKIPMEQIPATATQEIYTVTAESELISLVAQKGDLAQLIESINGEQTITKAWQLLTNDPTVFTNWVVWGTSYAVQAGHANTASSSDNANMINNHRMVEIAQADFDIAVKDENTYYLVW